MKMLNVSNDAITDSLTLLLGHINLAFRSKGPDSSFRFVRTICALAFSCLLANAKFFWIALQHG